MLKDVILRDRGTGRPGATWIPACAGIGNDGWVFVRTLRLFCGGAAGLWTLLWVTRRVKLLPLEQFWD